MAKQDPPKGCLYQRGRRWWYKLDGRCRPCRPDGSRLATPSRTAASVIAWRIYEEHGGWRTPLEPLIRDFERAEALSTCAHHNRNKIAVVRRFVKGMNIETLAGITPQAVEEYMAQRAAAGRSNKTILNERASLGRFCQYLLSRDELIDNPVLKTRPPKVKRTEPVFLTRNELAAALRVAWRRKMWAVFFAAYAGLRLGEITRLRWDDIRTGPKGWLLVVGESKSNRPRSVPVSRKLLRVIRQLKRETPRANQQANAPLFALGDYHGWMEYLNPIRAAVPKMRRLRGGWHDFRRTLASRLVQKGVSIYTVAKVLGHSDIKTTARYYAHLDAESGRADLDRL